MDLKICRVVSQKFTTYLVIYDSNVMNIKRKCMYLHDYMKIM